MKSTLKKASLDDINEFMSHKHIALAGVSLSKTKFGNSIFQELKKKDYSVYPVHPSLENFEGTKCYPDVNSLPMDVKALIICTKPENVPDLVKKAIEKNIKYIWIQQGAQNDVAIQFAIDHEVKIIHRECVLMFANPVVSVHKFHRAIKKLFGSYPKPGNLN